MVGVKRVGSAGGERDIMVVGFGRMGEGEEELGFAIGIGAGIGWEGVMLVMRKFSVLWCDWLDLVGADSV